MYDLTLDDLASTARQLEDLHDQGPDLTEEQIQKLAVQMGRISLAWLRVMERQPMVFRRSPDYGGPMQKPSVARMVHYQSFGTPGGEYPSVPRAAVITEVNAGVDDDPSSWIVGLCVLNPTGQFFNRNVVFSESPSPGRWNWPPRV